MNYLESYLDYLISNGKKQQADAVKKTTADIVPKYIENFSFTEHVVSLLFGNVQSGKTTHVFGIINAAADEGFRIFVLLTTDNILLQQQTLNRAKKEFSGFAICDETDYIKFSENKMRKPVLIVLKKNPSVLKLWETNFASTSFCKGNPLFIVDDEGDAASPNTRVNKKDQSTINKTLTHIKETSASSIYLQVTGTPQALLLQTVDSGWKPYFTYYFDPGKGYLGGDFFFNTENSPNIILTDDSEGTDILEEDEFPENNLKKALIMHLITSAHLFLNGETVCNFMVHPSVRTEHHSAFADKIGRYLNEISSLLEEEDGDTIELIQSIYDDLKKTKSSIKPFDEVLEFITRSLNDDKVNILLINSNSPYTTNEKFEKGINVLIGGNSLGRGLTFPKLQTIYYCRVAKRPQADTMWQHSRMFGYDRDSDLLRVFMPPILYKLFSDINTTNNSIIAQMKKGDDVANIKIYYPENVKPTRGNVIDKHALSLLSGGVNYFPMNPTNTDICALDNLLSSFDGDTHSVNLNLLLRILEHTNSETNDFKTEDFISFIKAFIADKSQSQGILLVRRERDIAKGTGTLLSPNDRELGALYPDNVVITMYKVTGTKGWGGEKLWIPNIKLPSNIAYYNIR